MLVFGNFHVIFGEGEGGGMKRHDQCASINHSFVIAL